ncbi:MAG: RadC family protein [Clostridia bacterium]|nr:RadC family protein [Clostridia bacterium]
MEKKSSLHEGHRARLRERFLRDPESLADHELLELALFYTIPRRDTNDLAHSLIEEFGSLSGVLEADAELLKSVEGIRDAASTFLRMLGELSRRYAMSKLKPEQSPQVFDTPDKIAAYILPFYMGLKIERAYMLLFDNGMHLIDLFHIGDGSIASVTLSTRRIAEHAFRKGAVAAVLTHNHPGGISTPSAEDVAVTRRIEAALQLLEITLLDHFVFTEKSYTPVMRQYQTSDLGGQIAASSFRDILNDRLKRFGR